MFQQSPKSTAQARHSVSRSAHEYARLAEIRKGVGKASVQLVAQRLGASRWSLWELFRAKRPRATSRAPVGWSGARNVLIHQATYRARLVELPDAQSQKTGGGEVLDLEKL